MSQDESRKRPRPRLPRRRPKQPEAKLERVTFADLPGWERDDHSAAFKTFLKSCDAVIKAASNPSTNKAASQCKVPVGDLAAACRAAQGLDVADQGIGQGVLRNAVRAASHRAAETQGAV